MSYATVVTAGKWKIIDGSTVLMPLADGLVTINFNKPDKLKSFALDILHALSGEKLTDLVAALTLTETEDSVVEIPDTPASAGDPPPPLDSSSDSTFFEDPVVVADRERALFGEEEAEEEAEEVAEEVAEDEAEAADTVGAIHNAEANESDESFEYDGSLSQELYRPGRSRRSRNTRSRYYGF